jgi:hypothetical protein
MHSFEGRTNIAQRIKSLINIVTSKFNNINCDDSTYIHYLKRRNSASLRYYPFTELGVSAVVILCLTLLPKIHGKCIKLGTKHAENFTEFAEIFTGKEMSHYVKCIIS